MCSNDAVERERDGSMKSLKLGHLMCIEFGLFHCDLGSDHFGSMYSILILTEKLG